MIEGINSSQNENLLKSLLPKQLNGEAVSDTTGDASLQVDWASLINQAVEVDDDDAEAVQRAQELLLSGQLEDEVNIDEASENILTLGV